MTLQGVEHGTHSIQGCKKASGKEVGKKAAVRGESPPAADSTGMISHALAGDSAFLKAGNALISCHLYTPELPQQAVCYQIQVSLPKQPHQSCLSGNWSLKSYTMPYILCQIHTQGTVHWSRSWENDTTSSERLQLFPLLIETQFKYCPGAACHCPTLGLK